METATSAECRGSISMGIITQTFNAVTVKRIKRGRCTKCGAKCQVTKRFFQTLNPFNKNAAGLVKTTSEIRVEETAKANAWQAREPLICRNCASGG